MPLPGIALAANQTENNNNADFYGVKLVPVKFPLLQPFSAISPKLDLLQMSAKDLAAFDVGNGTSIHQAAKNHGLKYYQVYRHLAEFADSAPLKFRTASMKINCGGLSGSSVRVGSSSRPRLYASRRFKPAG